MKEIVFSLPQEALGTASSAVLLGDFNNWDIDQAIVLEPIADGTLKATVNLTPGKAYEYRFLLNDGRWVNDWAAQAYVRNEIYGVENSVIYVEEEITVVTAKAPAKKKAAAKAAKTPAAAAVKPKKAAAKATKPVKKAAVTEKDDLTKIEGIGPAIAKLLTEKEIASFKDLSKATIKGLKGILDAAGNQFALHDPKSWPKQAKLAAAGKWEALDTLQKELTGGK